MLDVAACHFLSLHMTWRRKHGDVGRCRLLDTCEAFEANWLVKRPQVYGAALALCVHACEWVGGCV